MAYSFGEKRFALFSAIIFIILSISTLTLICTTINNEKEKSFPLSTPSSSYLNNIVIATLTLFLFIFLLFRCLYIINVKQEREIDCCKWNMSNDAANESDTWDSFGFLSCLISELLIHSFVVQIQYFTYLDQFLPITSLAWYVMIWFLISSGIIVFYTLVILWKLVQQLGILCQCLARILQSLKICCGNYICCNLTTCYNLCFNPAVQDPCCICYHPIHQSTLKVLPCDHHLHQNCFNTWTNNFSGTTCPMCRQIVVDNIVVHL